MSHSSAQSFMIFVAAVLAVGMTEIAHADESAAQLKDAPDASMVATKCSICHSVDYIQMNAPFMKHAGWEAEVRKMVKVMGAPIDEDDIARVVDYLTQQYGTP